MPPIIIAHRGGRADAPENTLEAISESIQLPGISGIEFDVELSDEPLVLHQESMVPNPEFTALQLAPRDFQTRDWVAEYPAEEIVKLDAGSWRGAKFSNSRVPKLTEVMQLEWGNKRAFMELKDPTFWGKRDETRPRRIVEAVSASIRNFKGDLSVISFNPEILKEVALVFPAIPTVLALWTEWVNRIEEAVITATNARAQVVSLPEQVVLEDPSWISKVHDAGLELHVYEVSPTIDEPEYYTWNGESRRSTWELLLNLQVDGILTDFPRELLAFTKAR